MRISIPRIITLAVIVPILQMTPVRAQTKEEKPATKPEAAKFERFKPEQVASKGSVTVGGHVIDYDAYAGTIIVHPKGWNDVPESSDDAGKKPQAEASMFYVAYFKTGEKAAARPLTFLYNGGPGSSTIWLHMGAFGPRRVRPLRLTGCPEAAETGAAASRAAASRAGPSRAGADGASRAPPRR